MASLFNITTATGSVTLDAQRTGKVAFTVSNTSADTVPARARVTSPDGDIVAWFTIDGQNERTLTPGTTDQYTVHIAIPPAAAAKDYRFSLLVTNENNPDEDFTEGPAVEIVGLVPSPPPPKKPFPWWIVVGAVLIVVIIVVVAVLVGQNIQAQGNAQSTQNAANTATAVIHGIATQTAAEGQTLTAQANARATQTAVALTQTALAPTSTFTPSPTPTPIPPQFITVSNKGGFVVSNVVVSYDTPAGRQSQSSGSFPVEQSTTLVLPGNATNVVLQISYSGTSTTCNRTYAQATSVNINVSGLLPNPSCSGG